MRINNVMQENKTEFREQNVRNQEDQSKSGRPQESGSFYVLGFVRIHDPNNKEVFVETRE